MKPTAPSTQGVGSLWKALDVLEFIARADEPPNVGVVAAALDLPRPTVHRIIAALDERGMVQFDPSGRGYRLGFHLFELAHKAWADIDLRAIAREPIDRLRGVTEEAVVLGVRADRHFIVTDRRESLFGVRTAVNVGHMELLTASAFGLAILSELDEPTLAALAADLADSSGMIRQSDGRSIGFAEAVRRAAARGYGVRVGIGDDGVSSIAAPILDFLGRPIAAIGIVGPASRLPAGRLHVLAPDVIDAARRVTLNAGNSLQSIEPRPRPAPQRDLDRWTALPTNTMLGKTALWHREEGELYLADILAPAILAVSPEDNRVRTVTRPDMAVVCGWAGNGDLLFADGRGVFRHDGRTGDETLVARLPPGLGDSRLNNGAVDPAGNIWLTSMNLRATPGDGVVLRLRRGKLETMLEGLSVPSGLAWSPDGSLLYLVDSGRGVILRAEYDPDSGRMGPLAELSSIDPADGTPDGIAVDQAGGLWVALWDGWAVARLDPTGRRTHRLDMPVPRPTGVSFGGPGNRELYVTTARIRLSSRVLSDAPLSGATFRMPSPEAGVARAEIAL
ncbi:MAG: hypothetical protein DI556_08180 [Rhodovulum sulfidophilum]|uniref:IclR family transcriptional regulator n=1 Tax=Rhodovulum sulfidophilum TaxID=35806 RepID=A0A2W5Q5Q6_RHOSU|nr:MAG: hypothetical protein DI556_08180 [Rhodovulum sulfidophilum]